MSVIYLYLMLPERIKNDVDEFICLFVWRFNREFPYFTLFSHSHTQFSLRHFWVNTLALSEGNSNGNTRYLLSHTHSSSILHSKHMHIYSIVWIKKEHKWKHRQTQIALIWKIVRKNHIKKSAAVIRFYRRNVWYTLFRWIARPTLLISLLPKKNRKHQFNPQNSAFFFLARAIPRRVFNFNISSYCFFYYVKYWSHPKKSRNNLVYASHTKLHN